MGSLAPTVGIPICHLTSLMLCSLETLLRECDACDRYFSNVVVVNLGVRMCNLTSTSLCSVQAGIFASRRERLRRAVPSRESGRSHLQPNQLNAAQSGNIASRM
jgi:hypothetical protein